MRPPTHINLIPFLPYFSNNMPSIPPIHSKNTHGNYGSIHNLPGNIPNMGNGGGVGGGGAGGGGMTGGSPVSFNGMIINGGHPYGQAPVPTSYNSIKLKKPSTQQTISFPKIGGGGGGAGGGGGGGGGGEKTEKSGFVGGMLRGAGFGNSNNGGGGMSQ